MIQFYFTDQGGIAQFWSYRTATVMWAVVFDLDEFNTKLVKRHIESCGQRMDNHICWKDAHGVYFMYSDHRLYVGYGIIEGKW